MKIMAGGRVSIAKIIAVLIALFFIFVEKLVSLNYMFYLCHDIQTKLGFFVGLMVVICQ
jgi:hypothetical protein